MKPGRAETLIPHGFSIPCSFAIDQKRRSPGATCVIGMSLPLCPRHRERLKARGYLVELAPPIAQRIAELSYRKRMDFCDRVFPTQKELL